MHGQQNIKNKISCGML